MSRIHYITNAQNRELFSRNRLYSAVKPRWGMMGRLENGKARRLVPIVCFGLILLSLFCTISRARAQVAPRHDALPEPIASASRTFSIPFEIRPDSSADPAREIELMVSRDRGARWHSIARQPVEAKKFDFEADSDGEYWFSFRIVTLSGVVRQSSSGPQIRVVVDATPPVLTLDMRQQPSGEMLVHWKAVDRTIQGRRPDFSVSGRSTFDMEKNRRPLNVDGRHLRVSDAEIEGRFLFWPENDAVEIELGAVLTDLAGNRSEQTAVATIKPVRRDAEALLRDASTANDATIASPDSAVSRLSLPDSEASFERENRLRSIQTTSREIPLTPPKPMRVARSGKRLSKTPKKAAVPEPAESSTASDRPAPLLFSPSGEPAPKRPEAVNASKPENPDPPTPEEGPTDKPMDDLTRQLLANMDRFFDGRLSDELQSEAASESSLPMPVSRPVAEGKAAEFASGPTFPSIPEGAPPVPALPNTRIADQADGPPKASPERGATSLPSPGKITGVSLNVAAQQPRIVVKWNAGDAAWSSARVDILRGESPNGPWLPVATNLPNNGAYWWFASSTDFKPFHVAVRLRGPQGQILLDLTDSPIRLHPDMLRGPSGR